MSTCPLITTRRLNRFHVGENSDAGRGSRVDIGGLAVRLSHGGLFALAIRGRDEARCVNPITDVSLAFSHPKKIAGQEED